MAIEGFALKGNDPKQLFPKLEQDFWENRKEFDYILQCSPHREEVGIYKVPKQMMRKMFKTLAKQDKKSSKGF